MARERRFAGPEPSVGGKSPRRFAVNGVVLVLRRDTVEHAQFQAPTALPFVGVIACVYLVLPWSSGRLVARSPGRPGEQYQIAGV